MSETRNQKPEIRKKLEVGESKRECGFFSTLLLFHYPYALRAAVGRRAEIVAAGGAMAEGSKVSAAQAAANRYRGRHCEDSDKVSERDTEAQKLGNFWTRIHPQFPSDPQKCTGKR